MAWSPHLAPQVPRHVPRPPPPQVAARSAVAPAAASAPVAAGAFRIHYTGMLVPDSTKLASQHTNAQLFEQFVPFMVASATYETPTLDLGFNDTIRFFAQPLSYSPGRGVTGSPSVALSVDYWADGGVDPGVYQPWASNTLTGRYIKARLTMASGSPGYISAFTPVGDKQPNTQSRSGVTAAPGGTAITFDQPYHSLPTVQITGQGALIGWYTSLTLTGFIMHLGTDTLTDTGGTGSWTATGV
jgi:hypothetical protein